MHIMQIKNSIYITILHLMIGITVRNINSKCQKEEINTNFYDLMHQKPVRFLSMTKDLSIHVHFRKGGRRAIIIFLPASLHPSRINSNTAFLILIHKKP